MNNKLIVVFGLPWSGKSTVTRMIQEYIGGTSVVLMTDAIRKELFPQSEYTQEESDIVYAEFYRRANDYLHDGKTVIMDAVFGKQSERDSAKKIARENGCSCQFLLVVLDENVLKERIENRIGDMSDADFEVYLRLKSSFEIIREEHGIINNSWDVTDLRNQTIQVFNQ